MSALVITIATSFGAASRALQQAIAAARDLEHRLATLSRLYPIETPFQAWRRQTDYIDPQWSQSLGRLRFWKRIGKS